MTWLVAVFFPIVLASLLFFPSLRPLICRHGLWTAGVPALVMALGGSPVAPGVFPALLLQTTLHFGQYGQVFLLLTALLWIGAGAFAGSYFAESDVRRTRFAFFYLLTMCGNLGLCVAQDLASFYVFFALMSFAAYGLIIHDQSFAALRAGRVYLSMTVIGEVLLASAFFYAGLVGTTGGTHLFAEIAPALPDHVHGPLILKLAFIGFGIKAGALILHLWLPLAHPAAPIPASAVLSGAMIKAGLLGWLHFLDPSALFAHELAHDMTGWIMFLAWLGLAAALYAVFSGLGKHDPKTILAYSSVSQMGLMTMALGFSLSAPATLGQQVLPGLLLFVLVHGLAKGFLFLSVGVARKVGWNTVQASLVLAGMGLAALVLAGLPMSGGAVVKEALKQSAYVLPETWSGFFSGMLSVTAMGTTLLLAVCLWRVAQGMRKTHDRAWPGIERGMALSWGGLLGLLLLAVPLTGLVLDSMPGPVPVDAQSIWAGLWPIGLGLLAAGAFLKSPLSDRDWKGLDDRLLTALEHGLQRLHQRWKSSRLCDPACGRVDLVALADRLLQSRWMRTVPDRLEQRLLYWHTAGVLFIVLLMGFIFLALRA